MIASDSLWTFRASKFHSWSLRAMVGNCVTWLLVVGALQAGELPRFREQVVTENIKLGYQLVSTDLNGDGKRDLIAVDELATELAWFENPGWTRHVLAVDVPRPLNADCWDINSDGVPEIILAYQGIPRLPEDS